MRKSSCLRLSDIVPSLCFQSSTFNRSVLHCLCFSQETNHMLLMSTIILSYVVLDGLLALDSSGSQSLREMAVFSLHIFDP